MMCVFKKNILILIVFLFVLSLSSSVLGNCDISQLPVTWGSSCDSSILSDCAVECEIAFACDGSPIASVFINYHAQQAGTLLDPPADCTGYNTFNIPIQCYNLACDNVLNPCSNIDGTEALTEQCACDTLVANAGEYCCYNESDNYRSTSSTPYIPPNNPSSCPPSPEVNYDVLGNVIIDNSYSAWNIPLDYFLITLSSSTQTSTNVSGNFSFSLVPPGTYDISALKTFFNYVTGFNYICTGNTTVTVNNADVSNVEITIDSCLPASTNNCEDFSGQTCCNQGNLVANYVPLDYVCTTPGDICVESDECEEYTPPPQTCIPGQCYPLDNAYCNETTGELDNYSLPDDYDIYCSEDMCLFSDSDCQQTPQECVSDNLCNGICPINCVSSFDDPDCGGGFCDDSGSDFYSHKWCADYTTISGDFWLTPWEDETEYCAHCPNDESCDVTPPPETCGDGVLDTNIEECDYTAGNGVGNWLPGNKGDNLCEFNQCIQSSCTCMAPTSVCWNGIIEGVEQCENGFEYCNGLNEYCNSDTCQCDTDTQSSCNKAEVGDVISGISVSHNICNNTINLVVTISDDCVNDVESVGIMREVNGLYSYLYSEFNHTGTGINEIQFTIAITSDQTNNFNINEITYNDGSNLLDIEGFSESITGGDDYCINWDNYESSCNDPFCSDVGENVLVCDENNTLQTTPCPGICYIDDDNVAQCDVSSIMYDLTNCEKCMGLNGMFYDPLILVGETGITCEYIFNSDPNLPSTCFRDKLFSVIDYVKTCTDVDGCYDYKTLSVCENDPCLTTLDSGCEWVPYNTQTGTGICRPLNKAHYDCSLALEPEYNNLFLHDFPIYGSETLKATSSKICGMYGDCYYKFNDGSGSKRSECMNEYDIICSDLLTKTKCLGNNSQTFNISRYNLSILSNSDSLGIPNAKCYWSDAISKCYRDANDDTLNDEWDGPSYYTYFLYNITNFIDFSQILSDDITAQRDFINPNTSVVSMPTANFFGDTQEFYFSKSDNVCSNIKTYYCVDSISGSINTFNYHPQSPSSGCLFSIGDNWSDSNSFNDEGVLVTNYETGNYTLYYFSIDNNFNIEQLQAIDFEVYSEKPSINFEYEYSTRTNNYLNDLNISFVVDSYGISHCTAYLYQASPENKFDIAGGTSIDLMDATGENFSVQYFGLDDGLYHFNVTCTDINTSNTNSSVFAVQLQGDTRIFNVSPYYDVMQNINVDFELSTYNKGNCYYELRSSPFSTIKSSYQNMVDCYNNNSNQSNIICGKFVRTYNSNLEIPIYEYIVSDDFTFGEFSELYIYDLACEIEVYNESSNLYYNQTVEYNDADRIIFSEDYSSPYTNLFVSENGVDYVEYSRYSNGPWYRSPHMRVQCNDALTFKVNSDTPYNDSNYFNDGNGVSSFEITGSELIFNCSNIYYNSCLSSESCNNLEIFEETTHDDLLEDPNTNPDNNQGGVIFNLHYASEDAAPNPNVGDTHSTNVSVDNLVPQYILYNVSPQSNLNNEVFVLSNGIYVFRIIVNELLSDADIYLQSDNHPNYNLLLNSYFTNDEATGNSTITTTFDTRTINLNDIQSDVDFKINLVDVHGIPNVMYVNDVYSVDTAIPNLPIIEPIFTPGQVQNPNQVIRDHLLNPYPVIYRTNHEFLDYVKYTNLTNVYYVNDNKPKITGFTDGEFLNVSVKYSLFNKSSPYFGDYVVLFDQFVHSIQYIDDANPDLTHNLELIQNPPGYNKKGDTRIYITYIPNLIDDLELGSAILFDWNFNHASGKMTNYGEYSKYYRVTGIGEETLGSSSIIFSYIDLDKPLEDDLTPGTSLDYYLNSDFYFPYDNNYFELILSDMDYATSCATDNAGNLYGLFFDVQGSNGITQISTPIRVFVDDEAPTLSSEYPVDATINVLNPLIKFKVEEDYCGSGLELTPNKVILKLTNLDNDDPPRTVNLGDINFNYSVDIGSSGSTSKFNFTYNTSSNNLENGRYNVSFEVYDYANNLVQNNNWQFAVDTNYPSAPNVSVNDIIPESSDISYYGNEHMFFITESPIINLSFEDNVSINVSLVNTDGNSIDMDCSNITTNYYDYQCITSSSIDSDEIYILNITAYKRDPYDLSQLLTEYPGNYYNYRINYDLIAPEFNIIDLPLAVRSNSLTYLGVNITNGELTIFANVSAIDPSGDVFSYNVYDMSSSENIYTILLNTSEFMWWESDMNSYDFNVNVYDLALNNNSIDLNITIDDVSPVINITEFSANGTQITNGDDLFNISTIGSTLTLVGTVNDTFIELIYLNVSNDNNTDEDIFRQYVCEGDEEPPGCISDDGLFEFNFNISLGGTWLVGSEITNAIEIVAIDEAGNFNSTTLFALLDQRPPEYVNITIT